MRHLLLAALLAVAPLAGAWAEDTKLTLSETATVMVPPDELSVVLRAEAASPNAADAQRLVNVAMADALARAKQATGVTADTGGYSVFRDTSVKPERWQAGQTLALHSGDGAALLTLVGVLQLKGLAVEDLHWRLSDETERRAQAEAMRRAIGAIQARVDEAAGLLGLSFVRFTTVHLESPHQNHPPMRMMAMAAPAAAPPPSATSEDIPVSATVDVEAALTPK
jgi:predicted secreted protein